MKRRSLFIIFSVILFFSENTIGQEFKKEFDQYAIQLNEGKVSIIPKKDLAKFIGNSPIEISDYFFYYSNHQSEDSIYTDSKDEQKYIVSKTVYGIFDSLPILNSGKHLIGKMEQLHNQIAHDRITRLRAYNNYIKIHGKYLVASVPSKSIDVFIYKHNGDNGPEYDQDGNIIEYGHQLIPSGHLLIYDLENNKVILDKKHVSMLNLNDDGVFYGGQFLDSLQEFSFIKWDGEYSFQNLRLTEFFQDTDKLKTIIGNCTNIFDVNENLPYDITNFWSPPSFRYTTKNGNSGYFDFSGIHEVYENKTVFSPKFYVESEKLKHKNSITFEFPTFKITEASTSIDLAYDEYGNEYNDTIHVPIDTILVESRTCDTVLSAKKFIGAICLDHNTRIYATLADKNEYLNSNLNSNKTDYRFLNDFNALIKRN
jgi:hypothetical protein